MCSIPTLYFVLVEDINILKWWIVEKSGRRTIRKCSFGYGFYLDLDCLGILGIVRDILGMYLTVYKSVRSFIQERILLCLRLNIFALSHDFFMLTKI